MLVVEDGTGRGDANSYVSIEAADQTVWGSRYAQGWFRLDAEAKGRWLVEATRTLDRVCRWEGYRVRMGQALGWPRVGVMDWIDGWPVPENVVPEPVKVATALLAAQGASGDWVPGARRVRSVSVGATSVSYDAGPDTPGGVPEDVAAYVMRYVRRTVPVVRA